MSLPIHQRIAHMLSGPVLVDLLLPAYAQAHNCLEEEVMDDVKRGLVDAGLPESLRNATWAAVKKERSSMDDNELIELIAKAMVKIGRRPTPTPERVLDKMAALFAAIDINVGRASSATRAMLESPQGKAALEKSIDAGGEYLARKLFPARAPKE